MRSIFFVLSLILFTRAAFGQKSIYLENSKNGKVKELYSDRQYRFSTKDTSIWSTIESFTDSSLSVMIVYNAGCDSSLLIRHYGNKTDTIVKSRYPVYKTKTIALNYSDITSVKIPVFNNQRWLQPFGYGILVVMMSVVLIPMAAIDDGGASVLDILQFQAFMLTICAPPVFIGTRNIKYNLREKWKIKAQ
jgi:hypothetical protein